MTVMKLTNHQDLRKVRNRIDRTIITDSRFVSSVYWIHECSVCFEAEKEKQAGSAKR